MSYVAPVDEAAFFIERCSAIPRLAREGAFALDEGDAEAILTGAGRFAADILDPIDEALDRVGARYADGRVETAPGHRDAQTRFAEAGWTGLALNGEWGGQALPVTLNLACLEFWHAASLAFGMGMLLSTGAAETIERFGDEDLKKRYLPRLASGEWMATMALTEPSAGSDLAGIRTTAEPMGDGRFLVRGSKIFISYGEHDLTDNIVHLVLARLPDAPAGTKGISLFLVPKYLPGEDGAPGVQNDVLCTGIEHKMGLNGSPTCSMAFGSDSGAIGWLVGEPNRGLAAMFTMMNNARLSVGMQGVAAADAAWQKALAYALERRQGRDIDGAEVAIAAHPDVAQTLMTMRALTSGARFLALTTADAIDRSRHERDSAERAAAKVEADLLTPVAKAFCTDIGCDVASMAIQLHGGIGYVLESGISRHYRDARVTTIYEGTNAIQAIDLISRKLDLEDGAALRRLTGRWRGAVEQLLSASADVAGLRGLLDALDRLDAATVLVRGKVRSDLPSALAHASAYLRLFGLVAVTGSLALGCARADMATPLGQTIAACLSHACVRLLPETSALAALFSGEGDPLAPAGILLQPR